MSTKTKITTTDMSAEDRRRVQGIRDDVGGGRGSETGTVDWKQQWSVDFTCYHVAYSNTVSSLSRRCLILIFFSSNSSLCFSLQEILSVLQSCGTYFCTKCTLTLHMYPYI